MTETQSKSLSGYIIDSISEPKEMDSLELSNAERFIRIYVDNLLKKFRRYNDDKFTIIISGLKTFVDKDENALMFLLQELEKHNFIIETDGTEKNVGVIDITCINETKKEEYCYKYQIQNIPSIIELSSKTNISTIGIIIMRIVAQTIVKFKILYKAFVFDLDDTLWSGTLAEDGIKQIKENLKSDIGIPFIAFMNFVKVLASELGIFIAICSRNDSENVKLAISGIEENIFPIKEQIDCVIANYNDKSENIKEIAKQLSILPESVVFVDDNPIVREEVRDKMLGVFVPEWHNHSDLTTQIIAGCIFERNELSINSQEKRLQYKIIQTERKNNNLPELFIKVIRDGNHNEARRLYSKTNQFKLSQLNDNFKEGTESLYFEIFRKNGENLGICSAITYYSCENECVILNWAISCRYFEIGLEEFILLYMLRNHKEISFIFQETGLNKKVIDLIDKYYGKAIMDDCSSIPNNSNEFLDFYPDNAIKPQLLVTKDKIGCFAIYELDECDEVDNNTNLKEYSNG